MSWLTNKKFLSGLMFTLTFSYPFIVYFFGDQIPTTYIVAGLVSALIIRAVMQYRAQGAADIYSASALPVIAIMIGIFFWNEQLAALIYPVIMSASFALLLGWTLIYPPSLIERFARIVEPDLNEDGVRYTYKVTIVWMGYSLFNATASLFTVFWGDKDLWLLYNGFISYVLMGLLMGSEFLFRKYYRAKKKAAFTPVHRLLSLRNADFWKTYWDSSDLLSFPHYIEAMTAKIKSSGAQRVFLVSDDRAHFLAGFLAALYADLPVVLTQSDAPELLNELMQPGDILLTTHSQLESVVKVTLTMPESYDTAAAVNFQPLNPEQATVVFYTSGSTGKPKAVEKKLHQLEAEIEVLHQLWGQGPRGKFLSTVSHHHLYALLYSLLWPVCGGFALERRTFTYWGDLLGKNASEDFLISSPAHLGRFSVLDECPPKSFRHTFSSGAPLSYDAAVTSKKYLNSLPIEVYGSTETGGIAFRQQEQPNTPWKQFDCVEISDSPEGKLQVKSRYIDGANYYQTEDQITWAENDNKAFHLMGRADRIVKMEGKRVSLSEIEDKLCQNSFVSEAAVLVLEKSYRDELGAIIVLSEPGLEKLKAIGKLALTRQLREALGLYFHLVVTPRKWRFVSLIPVNAQGKRLLPLLKECFINEVKSNLGINRQPILLKKDLSENKVEYSLKIPHDLAYFEGHFNKMAVVPGVVQLNWVVEFAKADLGVKGNVSLGNQIKFTNLMRPNDEVFLCLEYIKEKSAVSYSYKSTSGGSSYSSGRMTFSEDVSNEV
jgi:acyl-coenzyme A synthetase/AMP-(fatty) acid ligase/uncharacterized membrane protein/3-hydroxymyristoyl/3-hydroxydecanoyl-(acyl carrier protein) dehydratase